MPDALSRYDLATQQAAGAEHLLAHYRRQMLDNPGDALAKERFEFARKLAAHRTRQRQKAYVAVLRSHRDA